MFFFCFLFCAIFVLYYFVKYDILSLSTILKEEYLMKKITKNIIAALSASSMLAASFPITASASQEKIQPKGSYHVYGDINNDGIIIGSDATYTLMAVKIFEGLTGSQNLPLEYAIARPAVYFPDVKNPVPQAADVNGDGIINQADADEILLYYTLLSGGNGTPPDTSVYNGKCGQVFFIP